MQRLKQIAGKSGKGSGHCCRLKAIESLVDYNRFCLNVGSKEAHFRNSLSLDTDPKCRPNIVADARCLPLRSEIFEQALFTDVIEHLPKGDEIKALTEVRRVLMEKGELILTTPNKRLLFTLLDPASYLSGHRHYTLTRVRKMLETCGFRCVDIFTSGFIWACTNVIWYVFVTYPIRKIFDYRLPYAPWLLQAFENKEYEKTGGSGYTIFVKALKHRTA